MTQPRSALISLESTPYYHCISRCVRRAWLCGQDKETGRSFDHRKGWLVERFKLLSETFAIDIAAYAVMSNHYHLVLHVDQARTQSWSLRDIAVRWTQLYRGPKLIHRFLREEVLTDVEQASLVKLVNVWRSRLCSISWFMSCLNYKIAVQANREDGCTGRFWQGRFESQALLDETALLSCMTYVDLNPIRAGIADSLDDSDFTSIQDRIRQVQGTPQNAKPALMPFDEMGKAQSILTTALPYTLKDYVEIVDWTGRAVRNDKSGYIHPAQPKLLGTLQLSPQQWRVLALEIQKKSILMLHGLQRLEMINRQSAKILAG